MGSKKKGPSVKIQNHGMPHDWCHLCGVRSGATAMLSRPWIQRSSGSSMSW
jgi:hypothetical protein